MHSSIKRAFNVAANWKRVVLPLVLAAAVGLATLTGCSRPADTASYNLSVAADNFEITRRIIFYNGITGDYILNIEGRCSINHQSSQLEVTCKTGEQQFKKHFLGLSDNVTYFAEQVDAANASEYHYRVMFRPQTIAPDIDFKGDAQELQKALTPDRGDVPSSRPRPAPKAQ